VAHQTDVREGGALSALGAPVLDNAVWAALDGPHAHLAERSEMGVPPAEGWGRIRPPGWTEISAVCTDPQHRGRGLATRLIRAVAAGVRERGDVPFRHAAADNAPAIRLYESIGFTLRRRSTILLVRSPESPGEAGAL
jgi:ribosomal protein S18 acetylase RimI-like enzyme